MSKPALKVEFTRSFQKDYKKLLRVLPRIRPEVEKVVESLAQRKPLPAKYRDHSLKGNLKGLHDCHVRGDVVLLYRVEEERLVLLLIRIGSHSELGL